MGNGDMYTAFQELMKKWKNTHILISVLEL